MSRIFLGYVWSFVAVPIVFALCIYMGYDYSLERGLLPAKVFPRYLWYVIFSVLIISGLVPIFFTKFRNKIVKIISLIVYACIMSAVLFYVHLEVACQMGDCL